MSPNPVGKQQPSDEAPGAGEWHGSALKIQPGREQQEAVYESRERRHATFARVLDAFMDRAMTEGRSPQLLREFRKAAAEHYGMGFADRGRRYRPTDNTETEPQTKPVLPPYGDTPLSRLYEF
jgi:hypothetical protein